MSGTQFTIEREFRVISALHAAGLPVPGILAFSARHNAMLMEFVEGTTSYQVQVSPQQQLLIQADLMKQVVSLHGLNVRDLGLTEYAALTSVASAVTSDLATLESMYRDRSTLKEPEIDFALRWLAANIPDGNMPSCLVHGDVGPGNFIFGEDGQCTGPDRLGGRPHGPSPGGPRRDPVQVAGRFLRNHRPAHAELSAAYRKPDRSRRLVLRGHPGPHTLVRRA